MGNAEMITVSVSNVSISNVGFVVLLRSEEDERTLPIFIGVPEAQAIAIQLNGVTPPRPLTHDLMKNVLDAIGGRLDRVEVHDLKDGTFFGKLVIVFEGQALEIDSRASDAIALALRCHSPLRVARRVMDEAGVLLDRDKEKQGKRRPDAGPADPVSQLKAELARAIVEERYEEAAKIRDQITKASQSN